jgi:hypothetical protein
MKQRRGSRPQPAAGGEYEICRARLGEEFACGCTEQGCVIPLTPVGANFRDRRLEPVDRVSWPRAV